MISCDDKRFMKSLVEQLRHTARSAATLGLLTAAACSAELTNDAEPPELAATSAASTPTAALVPNDPYYPLQWHYPAIRLPEAWGVTTGSPYTRIAILDTGRAPHSDLDGKWISGLEYDAYNQDGDASTPGRTSLASHVAGIIAGGSNNGVGGAGVCWNCKILNVPITDRTNYIDDQLLVAARGITWAVDNGAQVIHMSFGTLPSSAVPCSDVKYSTLRYAISQALNRGVVLVAAAGGFGINAANTVPASCPGVISVAATDRNNQRASYSNWGPVTLAAPGGGGVATVPNQEFGAALGGCPDDPDSYFTPDTEGVVSAWSTSGGTPCYRYLSGTAMASAHVAGVVGLMLSRNPSLTPAQVLSHLQRTAAPAPACASCGAGLLDAAAAVAAVAAPPVNDAPPVARFAVQCTGFECSFDASTSTDDRQIVSYQWLLPGTPSGPGWQPVPRPDLQIRTGAFHFFLLPGFGSHSVRLRVVDSAGQSHETSQIVTTFSDGSVPRAGSFTIAQRPENTIVIYPVPSGNFFVGWFTFEPDGRGGGEPVWYNAAVGPVTASRFSQPLFRYTWPVGASGPTETRVGTLSLEFASNNKAWASWVINGVGGGDRYIWSKGGSGRSGVWAPTFQPGWGIVITEDFSFGHHTTFYVNDQPRWVSGSGFSSNPTHSLSYYQGPGLCPSCGGKTSPTTNPDWSPPSMPSTLGRQIASPASTSGTAIVNINAITQFGVARYWPRQPMSSTVPITRLTRP